MPPPPETLDWLTESGIRITLFGMRPMYEQKLELIAEEYPLGGYHQLRISLKTCTSIKALNSRRLGAVHNGLGTRSASRFFQAATRLSPDWSSRSTNPDRRPATGKQFGNRRQSGIGRKSQSNTCSSPHSYRVDGNVQGWLVACAVVSRGPNR